MFSRLGSRLSGTKDPLYALRDRLVAQGLGIVDLVSGNVNDHGIVFPQPLLEEILVAAARKAQVYAPDSLGQRLAREAIGAYYGASGLDLEPGRILLTPGTSISYWYAFKLLADEGDEVLVPSPSYPLFDYIAQLAGIRLVPYRMVES
jgi:alanine-synthesizing transaminase